MTTEREQYLEGLVAIQADAAKEALADWEAQSSFTPRVIARLEQAISATAETVQAFRDKLTAEVEQRGAVKALEEAADWFNAPEQDAWDVAEELRRMATSKKAG